MRKLLTTIGVTAAAVGLAATTVAAAPPEPSPSIVDVAVELSGGGALDENDGDFDILVTAVGALGLADELTGRQQRTVFAPTDGAFIDLATFLTASQTRLTEAEALAAVASVPGVADIVRYHIAPGARTADEVVPASQIRTITKQFIPKAPGTATLDAGLGRTATIVVPDVPAANGVIHAIDQVLLPAM